MVRLQPLTLALVLTAGLYAGPAPAAPAAVPTPAPTPAPSPLPLGDQPVRLDPAEFTARVANPYLPLAAGSRWSYSTPGIDGDVRTEVTAGTGTQRIADIDTVPVRSVTTDAGGSVIRDATRWYAQDGAGNVWLFGESGRDYIEGTLTGTDGWQAGRDGAQPGIAMPARPVGGQRWRIAYSRGRAEDQAQVVGTGGRVSVPAGAYGDVVTVEETSRLRRGVRIHRSYAPGVGLVRSESPGAADRTRLVAYRSG
ncbi:hypothetical protein [Catellatospora sp. NPDC049609]|uniref:hypothetical protein n=1 Tax=Catellatospora sp. NPDC049609 TaxID=3155505 RepID=UPI0034434282